METIKYGSRGEAVKVLQKKLNLIEDGIFGKLTLERVLELQRTAGLVDDGVVGPKTWEVIKDIADDQKSESNGLKLKRSVRKIKEIIVHCTASVEGQDMTVEQIRKIHVQHNGWADIGYHYVVYRDGTVHEGRPVDKSGAHVQNRNTYTIGVVYVGGCYYKTDSDGKKILGKDGKYVLGCRDTRTPAQKKSLASLVRELVQMYGLKKSDVRAHYEFANKACPCFNIESFRKEL